MFYVGVQKYSWKTKTGETDLGKDGQTDLGKDETTPTLQMGRWRDEEESA
jgi:hypothetical protein